MDHVEIDNVEKFIYMYFSGHFNDHVGAMMQYAAHCPMEAVHGCTGSHWTPPLGKYLHHIVPAAAMVIDLAQKIKLWHGEITVPKLAFNRPHKRPSTQLIKAASCVERSNATI